MKGPFIPPSSQVEEHLAQVWREVLGVPQVGVQDRFLDLGGDSILATELVARIRQAWGIDLSLLDLFQAPTISQQAMVVDRLRAVRDTTTLSSARDQEDRDTWVL